MLNLVLGQVKFPEEEERKAPKNKKVCHAQ
jgi:hypothetical protein